MSETNEESEQEASLSLYKAQLSQVEQAVQVTGESADLVQLKNDLTELIALTEENLLQLKKARLLKSLGEAECLEEGENPQEDEYAAFQASISETSPSQQTIVAPASSLPSQSSVTELSSHVPSAALAINSGSKYHTNGDEQDSSDSGDENTTSALMELVGTKCQAPIRNDWGGHHYGNAMIWSVDDLSEATEPDQYTVRVIFLNPTQPSMVPCKYFMDGSCRFSAQTCRRSHGQAVLVSELRPYIEPDHSKICEGCRCLVKSPDGVWYPASVTDVCDDNHVNVKFDAGGTEATALVEEVLPISEDGEGSDDESDSDSDPSGRSSDNKYTKMSAGGDDDGEESDALPVYLWRPTGTTDRLGAWEDHTKGVGSRLMAKMGYVTGQGLGPKGDGRAEPVPIMLLPQGKSLDKIMELKEMAGNADLFNAMKKLEKQQKVQEKKEAEKEKRREAKSNRGVFGFLNKKLHEHAADMMGVSHTSHSSRGHQTSKQKKAEPKTSSARELEKRSDKDVNIQIFQTAEEIRKVQRELTRLQQQLARNESRDRKMAEQVKQKIAEQESYLQRLKTSSQTLETHKQSRTAHKKLTIF